MTVILADFMVSFVTTCLQWNPPILQLLPNLTNDLSDYFAKKFTSLKHKEWRLFSHIELAE